MLSIYIKGNKSLAKNYLPINPTCDSINAFDRDNISGLISCVLLYQIRDMSKVHIFMFPASNFLQGS